MAAPLCKVQDVADQLGTTFEQGGADYRQVEAFCTLVSALIRARRPLVDQWIAEGVLDPDLVTGVAVQVVARLRTTAETGGVGLRGETHPEYSYELTASAAAGLNLTKAELTALTPAAGRQRPFSIIPR